MPVFFVLQHTGITNTMEQDDLEVWNRHLAVFAMYKPAKEPLFASAHTHVSFTRLPEEKWPGFDTLSRYALAFKKQCRPESLRLLENEKRYWIASRCGSS
jgi:hypothetical protein